MSEVTVSDVEQMIEKAFQIRGEIDALKAQMSEKSAELDGFQQKILQFLTEFDKTSYRAGAGMVVKQTKFSVSMPKDPDAKARFFRYIKERNLFEDLVTVHHQTLNSFYNAELEAAKETGDIDFGIPGIDEPKTYEIVAFRK